MTARTTLLAAMLALGVAVGGFADGIVFHQILQWHHLLSAVAALDDVERQIAADGWLHVVMFALAAAALVTIWRERVALREMSGRRLLAALAAGVGAWHVLDTVVVHWLLGWHRVRMDVENPLAWDMLFVAIAAAAFALAAWLWRDAAIGGGRRAALWIVLFAVTVGGLAAPWPRGEATYALLLSGDTRPTLPRDVRIVALDRDRAMLIVRARPERATALERVGLVVPTNSPLFAMCVS